MDTRLFLVSALLAVSWTLVTCAGHWKQSQNWPTCIFNVTFMDFQGRDYGMRDLCVARDNRVMVGLRCVTGSRYGGEVMLNPCLEGQPAATLQCGTVGDKGSVLSMEVRTGDGEMVDTAHHTFHPSREVSSVLHLIGELSETRWTVAVSMRCGQTSEDNPPEVSASANRLTNSLGPEVPPVSWDTLPRHAGKASSRLPLWRKRDVRTTRRLLEIIKPSDVSQSEEGLIAAVMNGESGNSYDTVGKSTVGDLYTMLPRSAKHKDSEGVEDGSNDGGDLGVQGELLTYVNSSGPGLASDMVSRGGSGVTLPIMPVQDPTNSASPRSDSIFETSRSVSMTSASLTSLPSLGMSSSVDRLNFNSPDSEPSDKTGEKNVTLPDRGELNSTEVKEETVEDQNVSISQTSTDPSEASTTPRARGTPSPSPAQPVTTSASTTSSSLPSTTTLLPTTTLLSSTTLLQSTTTLLSSTTIAAARSSTTVSKLTASSSTSDSITSTRIAQTTPDNTKPHETTSSSKRNQTTQTVADSPRTTNSVTTDLNITTQNSSGSQKDPTTKHATSFVTKDGSSPTSPSTHTTQASSATTTPTTPTKIPFTKAPSTVLYTTLEVVTNGNSSGLAQDSSSHDSGSEEGDTFWPIVAALVIGIPSIIVFGIAIIVIHRRRRVASPSNRLRAASMYAS